MRQATERSQVTGGPDAASRRDKGPRHQAGRRGHRGHVRDGRFCGAQHIHDVLRRRGQHVGLATVYRYLHVLAERGEVDTIYTASGESRYRLRASSATCHLICRACGCIVAVDGGEILDWGKQVAAETGYTFTGYTVEVSGLCPAHAG